MSDFYLKPGQTVTFSKTVGEYDVYTFAGLTGDFSSNHVNEEVMKKSKYKHRIAHGAMMVGFMSTASTMMVEKFAGYNDKETAVSLGYDRIRFIGAVAIGDTVTVNYTIKEIDPARRRSRSEIKVTNQNGELVTTGEHILKWVPND